MITISKPLSGGQARRYHAEEFQNARENYYTETDEIRGLWYGQLAERWGLVGDVRENSSSGSPRVSIRSPASNWSAIKPLARRETPVARR